MKSLYTLLLVALLGLPAGASARDRHLLWAVQGEHNTVWLLGSVHVLRAGEATLPTAADEAFDDAEQIVMEIDLDGADADPIALATAMQSQALLPEGQTLRSVLGPDYAAIDAQARQAGLNLASLDAFQPWLVAMAVLDQELARRGRHLGDGAAARTSRRDAAGGWAAMIGHGRRGGRAPERRPDRQDCRRDTGRPSVARPLAPLRCGSRVVRHFTS